MKRNLLLIALLAVSLPLAAQKPSLDHSVYDNWKSVGRLSVQNDAEWAQWTVAPQEGDSQWHLYNMASGREFAIDRASGAKLSEDASKAVFRIAPLFSETRQAKIDKKKEDKMPKDSLGVLDIKSGRIEKFANVKAFKSPEYLGNFIAFQSAEKDNDTLYVMNLSTLAIDTLQPVDSYSFPEKGDRLAYITKPGKKDSTTVKGVFCYDPATKSTSEILSGEKKSTFKGLNFSENGDKLVFFANLDTTDAAKKSLDLYLYDGAVKKLLAHDSDLLPKGWKIGDNRRVEFFDGWMSFGTCPVPREKDTTLVEFEQAKLDIWVWNDEYIQPQQLVNVKREKERTYLARIGYDGSGFVQLSDEQVPDVTVREEFTQEIILAATDKPYRMRHSWDYEACIDVYRISIADGSRRKIMEGVPLSSVLSSPDGSWYAAFNNEDNNWYIYDLVNDSLRDITSSLGVNFYDEDNDRPMRPGPCSRPVWSEDSKFFWIGDRYDIWQFDPTGKTTPFMVTEGIGRATNTTYTYMNPYSERSRKSGGVTVATGKSAYFTLFNHTTKQTGFAVKDIQKKKSRLTKLVEGPYTYADAAFSAGKKGGLIYTRANFEDGKNIWMTKDSFKSQQQLTDINPQQRGYNWGTVELVSWTTEDGIPAEGLLFKPENFDPSKKYPVIIYFYEKYSDELYVSRSPAPSASTVNIPYFVSNGYVCFIPDIYYTDGHPGQSCLKSLMPACDMLCEYPWIDGDNMAIQGQSWGGYQVAYLITQTGRFKAAGAGAPVSNMTSAYGGIRWESGMVRTFQYEQQQSRIGDDLWHGFDLYVENSPLFFVPNVTTPVLIMHNDKDGAVPWWQGIEFYSALRRCGKQAWLLQYNDEAHNLRERRNRKDLSRRLEQFFGHFLKGEPMPVWMSKGVPATLKGIDYGFEYNEEK